MEKTGFRQALHRVFWIPFGVGAILALGLILAVQSLAHREAWVEHTDQVIAVSQRMYRATTGQESSLRAYLLTHDERFLESFYQGRDLAKKLERELEQLISDNPAQQERNDLAAVAKTEWSQWADQAVALARAGKNAGDLEFQLRGQALMDQYRAARTAFFNREEQLRDQRLANSRRTLRFVNLSIVGLCILMAGVLAGFGWMQIRHLGQSFNEAFDKAQANAGEWFRTTLSSIGDAVIATDAEGAITFMNPTAERLTGWIGKQAKGKPLVDVFQIVNQHTRNIAENPVDKVRRLNRVIGLANHTLLISRNGEEFAIDDSGAPILGVDGGMIGIVLVFKDVSRQRALESALQANERLALAGRLSASIAHEIHNPLDIVGNILFLLQQQTSGQPEMQQLVRTAQGEVHRVAQISKNMLNLQRESGSATLFKSVELIEGVVALLDETIAKGKRKIQITHGFSGEIKGFPVELRQVLTNVIKNAVEATREGGIIKITSALASQDGRAGVLFEVTDNGVGISDDIQSRLFTPFATTKQEGGTGLGLWVSRSIVERHGGTIRIGNRADSEKGTNVSILWPLEPPPSRNSDEKAPTLEEKVS